MALSHLLREFLQSFIAQQQVNDVRMFGAHGGDQYFTTDRPKFFLEEQRLAVTAHNAQSSVPAEKRSPSTSMTTSFFR